MNVSDVLDRVGPYGGIQGFLRKHNPCDTTPYGITTEAMDNYVKSLGQWLVQCNLCNPNLVSSEILFSPNKLFGPKVFYHLLHIKLPCVFRIVYIPNSEHKIKFIEYIIA